MTPRQIASAYVDDIGPDLEALTDEALRARLQQAELALRLAKAEQMAIRHLLKERQQPKAPLHDSEWAPWLPWL